ncbi:MAG: substrate-binding domain-containing protein [Faecalibacterium sp.]|nr:substrate-binding domain-containing protein [Ruminococcus sp.]MCM1391781.1 substrate-binding domain-containing protein [Ruminococcus sp.]MCM1485427.1 substrate-binding domain-containing protein [Faecalibacterium sp.]
MTNNETEIKRTRPAIKIILTMLAFALFSVLYFVVANFTLFGGHDLPCIFRAMAVAILIGGLETLTARKLKIPQIVLTLALILPIIVLLLSILFKRINSEVIFIDDMIDLIGIYFMFLTARIFVAAIDSLVHKNKKLTAALTAAALIICILGWFRIAFYNEVTDKVVEYLVGTPDRTGSWGSINQEVARDKNWKQIVKNSEFQLGEIKKYRQPGNDYDDYYCTWGTYPLIDGSTVCVPMAVEFAGQHLGFDDENSKYFTNFSTTHYAYERLVNKELSNASFCDNDNLVEINAKTPDIVIGTEPSNDELAMAKSAGVELVKKPVCYDAFVFITHKNNPVESLTVEQIKDIYSGKITNWKEVGGNDEKIVAYQREENSGSQTAMENLVMGGANMIDPITIKVIAGMGALVDEVAEYDNKTTSLGYTYRYYIDTLYKNDNIKTIAIEGIAPTDDNIRSEKYPFTTNYYGVIRHGDEDKTGGKFLDWMLTDEGQKCIVQAGYITIRETDDMIVEKVTDAITNIRMYADKSSDDIKLNESTLNLLSDKVKEFISNEIISNSETVSNYKINVELDNKKDLSENILQLDFKVEASYNSSAYGDLIRINYDRSKYKIVSYKVEGKGGFFGV